MGEKLKVVFLSNALWIKTGLSRNAKAVLKHLYRTKKYELIQYCSGSQEGDPRLDMYPWKCIGALPSDPNEARLISSDPNTARLASYGAHRIDKVIKEEKPDVVILSDDIWAFPIEKYAKAPWSNKDFLNTKADDGVHLVHHVTVDSIPILPAAVEQAQNSLFYTWASFGEKELKNKGCSHVGTINGAVEKDHYSPISAEDKKELRELFGIDQDTRIFFYLGRNQLRKKYDSILRAFSKAKKDNPSLKAKLLFHCSWTEGWPLERMMEEMGVSKEDVLTTYVCEKCGRFEIKPYRGEAQDCRFCGSKGSQHTSSIVGGVRDEEMKYVYGISDACISAFTSGGFEYCNAESMFCGLPLATVGYSCGSEYTECPAVYEIGYIESGECNSGFVKAEPSVNDIVRFIRRISGNSDAKNREIGLQGYEWAIKRFDSSIIGRQWEEVLDQFEKVDHSKVRYGGEPKNPSFPMPQIIDNREWVKSLYENILLTRVNNEDQGLLHWMKRLDEGLSRDSIYNYFVQTASQDNNKNKEYSLSDLLVKNGKKNVFLTIKESIGDCFLVTSLFESIRGSYPEDDYNFYVVTSPQYFEIFEGNQYVTKIIPYHELFENELAIMGAGREAEKSNILIQPCVATQRHLNYLSNNKLSLELTQ